MTRWLLNLWRRTLQHWWQPTPSSSASSLSSSPPRCASQDEKRGVLFLVLTLLSSSPPRCAMIDERRGGTVCESLGGTGHVWKPTSLCSRSSMIWWLLDLWRRTLQ